MVYKAKELGYHPQVILAGRAINDYMPKRVAEMAIKGLNEVGKGNKRFNCSYNGFNIQGERAGYEGVAGEGDGEGVEGVWSRCLWV